MVPDGFLVSDGLFCLPEYDPSPGYRDFRIFYPETEIDLGRALADYEKQVSRVIMGVLQRYGAVKADHCAMRIPIVGKFHYTRMGEPIGCQDYYDVVCNLKWRNDSKNPDVHLELLGLGYWKPLPKGNGPGDSRTAANILWQKRPKDLERNISSGTLMRRQES